MTTILIESSSAQLRLDEARTFVDAHVTTGDVFIIGATRAAADDLARAVAIAAGATIGLHRFSLSQLALRLAGPILADRGLAPVTYLGSEAVAARAAFDAERDAALTYFAPVARTPGFPRALARTLQELRLAQVGPERLGTLPLGGSDLAALLERFDREFANAAAIDRATLLEAATQALKSGGWHAALAGARPPALLFLDVPIDSQVELDFVATLIAPSTEHRAPSTEHPAPSTEHRAPSTEHRAPSTQHRAPSTEHRAPSTEHPAPSTEHPAPSTEHRAPSTQHRAPSTEHPAPSTEHPAPSTLFTVPFGDLATLDRLKSIGLEPTLREQKDDSDLAALRRYLFADRQPPEREPSGDVVFYSAPGEGRECVEIARRILQEAGRGVPFDEMAVFLRVPDRYTGLLEHALRRAGVPAWFDRGTRRPHPAGRAFLAILACAVEKLSARRFAEYLSLGQVPRKDASAREPAFVMPLDDEDQVPAREFGTGADAVPDPDPDLGPQTSDLGDDDPLLEGTLRAPWKWEKFIVESAVIGGDPARWHRRLAGFANELRVQRDAERRDDPDSPRVLRIERDLRNLGHLRAFALPVVDRLASWPASATWGEWLDRFVALTPMVLWQPERVQAVLEQLRPMAEIGPVTLEEARDVIADRLGMLEIDPPRSRYGRVFVGGPQQARGRTFRVAFVPGLAERMFPQHPHEDPLMLDDELRAPLRADLIDQQARLRTERLLLRLAVGAPTDRLWLSYPRLDTGESRPRVPSFYALDVMRAITGRLPPHGALQERAAAEGLALLAWPAPANAADAIDDLEHDLATLKALIEVEPPASVRGHAHYLLRLNECLKRSVSARWSRGRSQWTPYDGITRVTGMTKPMLDSQRLSARPYSLSALQKYASCPYQFLLSAIYRLEQPPDIEPLQKLDPLTRGSIFHEAQATFFRQLQADGRLPLNAADIPAALQVVDRALAAVAADYEERLAPAIERVWRDEIADIGRDLRVWVRRLPLTDDWEPAYFELAFGLPGDEGRDPESVEDPVLVDGRFKLRGSVDLIERRTRAGAHALRITDHKTGRNRTSWKTVIGGGAILQPVLYGLAIEQAMNTPVVSGRLFYCTSAGGFVDHEIPLNEQNRRSGLEALEIIDRAIELGFLPAAPAERACTWCDFRPICGPDEPRRVARKMREKLGDLDALREKP